MPKCDWIWFYEGAWGHSETFFLYRKGNENWGLCIKPNPSESKNKKIKKEQEEDTKNVLHYFHSHPLNIFGFHLIHISNASNTYEKWNEQQQQQPKLNFAIEIEIKHKKNGRKMKNI